MKESLNNFYDKHYKKILILPALLIILSLAYLAFFYSQNGDIIYKDVSLTGGTTVTFDSNMSISDLQSKLIDQFPNLALSSLSDNSGKQLKIILTVPEEPNNILPALEEALGYNLDDNNSSVEFTGSSLSQDFYKQLIRAVIFAFILMAAVVFLVFGQSKIIKTYCLLLTLASARLTFPSSKFLNVLVMMSAVVIFFYALYISKEKKFYLYTLASFLVFILFFIFPYYYFIILIIIVLSVVYTLVSVPSMAVIFSAFADILMPLVIIDLIGMQVSSAGIVAFLMLIGYSVDTDILLTSRVLNRKHQPINESIYGAFKTGVTMTLTSIIAVLVGLLVVYSFNSILNQIFTILIIGLVVDLFNTWITNTCLIKWYVERTGR